ncbi:hypothetical protein GCM10022402_02950 [Salinactinospora qingdaonensis]|uniref:Uncharacterized protein n=1 Tax=Salinactinospora qingdaonensis TaxID=702744 RepID=A0ABP7EVC4_9ACTN
MRDGDTYTVDGFAVTYLPEDLDEHGIQAESRSERDGSRTTFIAWLRADGSSLAKMTVMRNEDLTDLAALRDTYYPDLTGSLRPIEVNDSEGYLSPATGQLFWLQREGVGVGVYLDPNHWGSAELTRMAEGVNPSDDSTNDTGTVQQPSWQETNQFQQPSWQGSAQLPSTLSGWLRL